MGCKESNQTNKQTMFPSWENIHIKITYGEETEKRDLNSQTVRTEENLKLSYSGPCHRQTLGTNSLPKVLGHGHHKV